MYYNPQIAKTAAPGKILEFTDALTVANPEDYAMLFGVGGGKHAPNAVIKVTICDFTAGKGEGKSVTVSSTLEPACIDAMYAVAENRIVNPLTDAPQKQVQSSVPQRGVLLSDDAWNDLCEGFLMLVQEGKNGAVSLSGDSYVELGKRLRSVYKDGKEFLAKRDAAGYANENNAAPAYGPDYKYTQTRVNIYKKGNDGLAPVSLLTITHQAINNRGEVARYPWTVKITNGFAVPIVSDSGSIKYTRNSFRETGNTSIVVSDMDMFSLLGACKRFITAYSLGFGIPLVKNGVEGRYREYEERRNNRT